MGDTEGPVGMGSQRAAQRDQQHQEQMHGDKGVRVLKGKRRKRGDREALVLHGALCAPSAGGGLLHCPSLLPSGWVPSLLLTGFA